MNILLLGSTGMLGTAMKRHLKYRDYKFISVARSESDYNCDLTNVLDVQKMLNSIHHDAIINSSALVSIDQCEKNPIKSWNINAKLVSILSKWSIENKIPLLQISTDHFYPYGDNIPHKEDDPVICINEYARHKFSAEAFALASKYSLVIRTSLVGVKTPKKNTLVEWAIKNLIAGKTIELFNDAWTSSIEVNMFSELACIAFFDKKIKGLLNIAAGEVYSKEKLVRKLANKISVSHKHCKSVSIKNSSSLSANCLGLDITKAEQIIGKKMPKLDDICEKLASELNLGS